MKAIALDLGGTKLSAAIFDKDGKCSDRQYCLLNNRKGTEVGKIITETISVLNEKIRLGGDALGAVGVCVPGIVNPETSEVWAPNIPGWESYRLKDEIAELFADHNIFVVVNNDRLCYLYGEWWKGNAAGCSDVIFIAVGTGIGAGIMSGGKFIRGKNDIAGAIGWMGMSTEYQEKFKSTGFFEHYASGPGLVNLGNELITEKGLNSALLKTGKFTTEDIFHAWKSGDNVAAVILKYAVKYWGVAVANLVSIFNPEKIVFGGGVFGPGKELLEEIKNEAQKWAQPVSIKFAEITSSLLGSDAGLYGAGRLALDEIQNKSNEF